MGKNITFGWAARVTALVAALSMVLAIPVAADTSAPTAVQPEVSPPWSATLEGSPRFAENMWFVEFNGRAEIEGATRSTLTRQRTRVLDEARNQDLDIDVRFDFRRLWNGMSVRASASEALALSKLADVAAVYPVEVIERPEPETSDPDLATALAMTGADVAGSELGFTGEGIKVAIVDTGIDYQHPDLGGEGPGTTFPTARVAYGWDYVGEDYDASNPDNDVPQPDPDPLDIGGHGTHVAGIVGASAASADGVTGVAPEVVFGAYKVFGTVGSSTADVIIAALEDAHADGMDVINMSLGASLAWGDYPTSQVSNQLVEDGVVVVASAGNSGSLGSFTLGAPGNASDVIGVASADNLFLSANVFEVAGQDIGYLGIADAELPPTSGTSDEIVYIGRGCTSLGDTLEGDPAGKTALIIRGDCTFDEKYQTAVAAGATGVLIHNQGQGLFAGGGVVPTAGIWAAALSNADGLWIRSLLETETVSLTFTDRETNVANPTGGLISSFSSYGMTPDLDFRPDVTAPGGLINSTYPLASGAYAMLSGTSMAAPHVAGAVALLLEARPDLEAHEVRPILQNSATPLPWSLNAGIGFLDHTFRQGAGMIQIDDSLTATSAVSPSRIPLFDNEVVESDLVISNNGDEPVTYLLGHQGTIGTGGFAPGEGEPGEWFSIFSPQFVGPTTTAAFASETVTVAPGESATVAVTITNPDLGLYAHQAGGFITVTEDVADGRTFVVPYAGLADSLGDIEIWPEARVADTGSENLLVAYFDENDEFQVAEPGQVFKRRDRIYPVAAVFMGYAAERIEVTARHLRTGVEIPFAEADFARRSSDPFEYLAFEWDGKDWLGWLWWRLAPPGEWVFDVRAMKPRVSPDAPEEWVEGTTATFVLDRRFRLPPWINGWL